MEINGNEVYFSLFASGWAAVQKEFATEEPEPEQVYLAAYEYEDYSGDAIVVYRNGEFIYEVTGGHCSCYGLEDQFKPEVYAKSVYREALQKRIDAQYELAGTKALAAILMERIFPEPKLAQAFQPGRVRRTL